MSAHTAGESKESTRSAGAEHLFRFGGGSVALFGEMLVVGLVVTALSLPLVTAVPAIAAGVHHLDRHVSARSDGLGELLDAARRACRGGWAVGAVVAWMFLPLVIVAPGMLAIAMLAARRRANAQV